MKLRESTDKLIDKLISILTRISRVKDQDGLNPESGERNTWSGARQFDILIKNIAGRSQHTYLVTPSDYDKLTGLSLSLSLSLCVSLALFPTVTGRKYPWICSRDSPRRTFPILITNLISPGQRSSVHCSFDHVTIIRHITENLIFIRYSVIYLLTSSWLDFCFVFFFFRFVLFFNEMRYNVEKSIYSAVRIKYRLI